MFDDRVSSTSRLKRLPGSCDRCWRKKIRCDRANMDGVCTNCLNIKAECTHSRRKGNKTASITVVRSAKEHVAKILSTSTIYIPSNDPAATHKILVEIAQYARSMEEQIATLTGARLKAPATPTPSDSESSDDEPDPPDSSDRQPRYGAPLFPSAKSKDVPLTRATRSFQFLQSVLKHVPENTRPMLDLPWQREEFWVRQPWESSISEHYKLPIQVFPEKDLLDALVDLYFSKVNTILNLLHAPSFRRSVAEKKHEKDPHFGAVLLAVCALASRFSDDSRVLLDGTTDEHSCGWRWFSQVRPMRAVAWSDHPASLYQLQLICLSLSFMSASCLGTRDECWILAGMGLRFAQASGVHSRSGAGYTRRGVDTVDAELYRRAVWVLGLYDTLMSCFQGRPWMAQMDKMDLLPPAPISVEQSIVLLHDTNSNTPPVPSEVEFLNAYIELARIIGRIHEKLYPAADRDRKPMSADEIADLDSSLNSWAEGLPKHLKWNATQTNTVFLDQSATLHITYYHAQIILHRAFLPIIARQPENPIDSPSLSICANAARSCVRVIESHAKRSKGLIHHPSLTMNLFDAAVILILNMLTGRHKIKSQEDFSRATSDLESCVWVLGLYEKRWRFAGRRCDAIFLSLRLVRFALFDPAFNSANRSRLQQQQQVRPEIPSAPPPDLGYATTGVSMGPSFPRHSNPDSHIRALEESMAMTRHLFSPSSLGLPVLPSGHYAHIPSTSVQEQYSGNIEGHSLHGHMDIDWGLMFGAQFSSDAWPSETPPVDLPSLDSGPVHYAGADAWNAISGGYGWGEWNSYTHRIDSE
ncbi:Zn(2)-C6 fungal-type domain-containing protein [Mycena indigotica]|uniref:Zn(2)-C6 fungal-type domain-containing protein n=1 Tax=Mycena indigotica TaxID=2126181 RepID=A0A8H6T6Z9_9AGAR|nr:Zn(2)-C6 fungal-type domain-containing protein [Mycena indigotica]KAF7311944.1 Zn(2)-C6 fungal-type domain-containing protein [Mycena indigotica]